MFNLRRWFMLDPDVVYLNHGSFGATPRPVFREYQRWQRELETQPVAFFSRRYNDLMSRARAVLGNFLGTAADNVVYVTNVTMAVNIVARSLLLGPGDEVLASDHEYGACDRVWRFMQGKLGFKYINQPIRVPVTSPEAVIEDLWRGVTPRTRLIFVSHITSPTALILPVTQICRQARQAGILTMLDGAHAPGQVPVEVETIGADYYGANLHKWLCAPKGAGFLYARPEVQGLLDPLVVSWGYESDQPGPSRFIDYHEFWGTRDPAAFLSVPAAIDFQEKHDWDRVRLACHELASVALKRISDMSGQIPLQPDDPGWYAQMVSMKLPGHVDLERCKRILYEKYRIEVPLMEWNGSTLIRISIQGYNSRRDVDALVGALEKIL